MPPIHLLLVDNHAMFRQGLALALAREPEFVVAGQCSGPTEALSILNEIEAAVILLDVLPELERSYEFVVNARKQNFRGKVLVVTAGLNGPVAVHLIQAGVSGIMHKRHPVDALCETIKQIARGEVYLEHEYLSPLFKSVDRTQAHAQAKLTERDKTVLRLVCQGLTNRDISTRLRITESGAKSALRQLFDKLDVRTRAQLVKVGLEQFGGSL